MKKFFLKFKKEEPEVIEIPPIETRAIEWLFNNFDLVDDYLSKMNFSMEKLLEFERVAREQDNHYKLAVAGLGRIQLTNKLEGIDEGVYKFEI